jgi:hypothetical protein
MRQRGRGAVGDGGACTHWLAAVGFATAMLTGAADRAAAGDLQDWLREADGALARVESYTTVFHKQERVGGRLLPEETVFFRFARPFKVRLQWIKEPHKGRDVVYIDGENANRLRVREGGLLGLIPVNLDPRGDMAMRDSRHPITDSGLAVLLGLISSNLERGAAAREVVTQDHGLETVYGRVARRFEGIFPKDAGKGYYCHRAELALDVERKVPLKLRIHDFGDQLVESYTYEDLRLNAGLKDADFALGR